MLILNELCYINKWINVNININKINNADINKLILRKYN